MPDTITTDHWAVFCVPGSQQEPLSQLFCLVRAERSDHLVRRVTESQITPMLLHSFPTTRTSAYATTATNAPSALVVSVRMRRRVMGFVTAAGMAAVVVLGTAVPASATVGDVFTVDYITYTVTSEDPATVAATDYNEAGGTTVVIPSTEVNAGTTYTVTSIGDYAFEGDRYGSGFALKSVTIPDSVTSIRDSAFRDNLLDSVTIPDSVTSIRGSAFRDNKLASVTIPNSVTSIGDHAFWSNSLTTVTIPNSVTSISDATFGGNKLESVTIPDSVTSIGSAAFAYNKLASVTIPNSVSSIGTAAFTYNLLESLTIPNSVTSIGYSSFSSNLLASVTIPDSVTSISSWAFNDNKLASVTIPDSVTSIGDRAFSDNLLESVAFAGPAPTLGTEALGSGTVTVYYYARYHSDRLANGFETPTWYGYPTSALVDVLTVSLDLGVSLGDAVADATVEIAAEGLLVGSEYTVVVRSTPTTIALGNASSTGTVSDSSGRMPSGLAAGPHTVTFTGRDADGNAVSRVAYLTVSDTGTVSYLSYAAAESLALAETGFEVAPFGAAALLLLAAGVVLVSRRRRVTA
jgi:hypothetical protein